MFENIRQRLAARRERKSRKFWAKMTDKKAESTADALAFEIGLTAAGNFEDQYSAKKAAGLTSTATGQSSRFRATVEYILDPHTPEAQMFRMAGIGFSLLCIFIILALKALGLEHLYTTVPLIR